MYKRILTTFNDILHFDDKFNISQTKVFPGWSDLIIFDQTNYHQAILIQFLKVNYLLLSCSFFQVISSYLVLENFAFFFAKTLHHCQCTVRGVEWYSPLWGFDQVLCRYNCLSCWIIWSVNLSWKWLWQWWLSWLQW